MQVTVAPNFSTSAVDPAMANGAASEVELSKQTEHSGKKEVSPTVVVDDTSYSPTGFKMNRLMEMYPQHDYLTCKRALELTELRLSDAMDLLVCETFTPSIDTASDTASNTASNTASDTTPDTASRHAREPSSDDKVTPKQPFPFMKLPQEVRLMVYKEHLVLPGPISTVGSRWGGAALCVKLRRDCVLHQPSHRSYIPLDQSVFGLFSASKSNYKQSVSMFFRHNDFRFANLNQLSSFLSRISVEARRSIAAVYVGYGGATPARTFKLLKECVGLRRLTLELSQSSIGTIPWVSKSAGFKLMKIYRLSDLLKVRGLTEVEVELGTPEIDGFIRSFDDEWVVFKKTLQVLKQPHSAAQLKRQEKKDYPQEVLGTDFT